MTSVRSSHGIILVYLNLWRCTGKRKKKKTLILILRCIVSCLSLCDFFSISWGKFTQKTKSNHLYCFSPDSKSLVWPCRYNMWTFFGPLLDFFWCNTHWESSHQNAHSGELLQLSNIIHAKNAKTDLQRNKQNKEVFIKSTVETCVE